VTGFINRSAKACEAKKILLQWKQSDQRDYINRMITITGNFYLVQGGEAKMGKNYLINKMTKK
jgi:hypothetical protein